MVKEDELTQAERMLKNQKRSIRYNYSDANMYNQEVIIEFKTFQKIKAQQVMQKMKSKFDS